MSESSVGLRELKSSLSKYMRQVKAGGTVLITEHGQPIGRIVPTTQSMDDKIQAMINAGLAEWNGQKFKPMKPVARMRGKQTISDIVIENRE